MPVTPSFEEMFGVGKVPIASYFNLPKGASADPQFSPQARELLGQGEDYAREQAAREAEIAAEELLGGAASMSDEQLQQQLTQNPRMFGTQAVRPLSNYMQYRQSTTPMSDEVLGPVIEAKITDPYHKERFRERMLKEGLSANDAYDAYITDEYNNKFEVALAEAGVPETEYAKLRTASGKFDPVAVPRAVAAARAAAKLSGAGKKAEPIDIRIETLKEALEERKKRLEARGEDLTKDERYQKLADELDTVYDEKLVGVRPPPPKAKITEIPSETATPAATVTTPPAGFKTPEERRKAVAAAEKEAPIKQAIDTAWTQQKAKLAEQIRKVYGDNPQDIILAAQAVLNGEADPEKGAEAYDEQLAGAATPSYARYLLTKVGRAPEEIAFEEPEGKRKTFGIGTQAVKNDELLQAWAQDVLALASQLQQTPATTQKPAGNIKGLQQIE